MTDLQWMAGFGPPPTEGYDLGESEIHVWAVPLTGAAQVRPDYLSWDEQARAERFRFPADRRRYTTARVHLRRILAQYVDAHPADLSFHYDARSKPSMCGDRTVEFNLSHSGELALVAVTRLGPVGVDLEIARPLEDLLDLARRNFCLGEYESLAGLRETERLEGFYRCWTRKEAYVKAIGSGLALSLKSFEVSLDRAPGSRLLSLGGSRRAARSWCLRELQPAHGYIGALAIEGAPKVICCWIWS